MGHLAPATLKKTCETVFSKLEWEISVDPKTSELLGIGATKHPGLAVVVMVDRNGNAMAWVDDGDRFLGRSPNRRGLTAEQALTAVRDAIQLRVQAYQQMASKQPQAGTGLKNRVLLGTAAILRGSSAAVNGKW